LASAKLHPPKTTVSSNRVSRRFPELPPAGGDQAIVDEGADAAEEEEQMSDTIAKHMLRLRRDLARQITKLTPKVWRPM
jgi:hypothetical protein